MRHKPGRNLPPGFGTVWVSVALDLVGFGIVMPILPLYAQRFHASAWQATALVAAFSAASFVFSPVWGRLSDRIGRKPVLLISLAGTAVGSVLTGVAGGLALLFVGRVVDGISGASVSVAQASVTDLAPPEQRARLFGYLGAAFGLGFVAGPLLGALAALAGPRVPFFVAAAIAVANALVASRRLPETHPGGAVAAPGRSPVLRPPGGVLALLAVTFCALTAFSAFESTLAIFGAHRLGLTIGSSAATFAAVGVVIVITQAGLVHPVVSRLGERRTLAAGLAVDAVGLAVLARTGSWVSAAPALLALTIGQGLVQTTMSSALAGRVDPARRGELLGAQQSAGGLARVAGPVFGGILLGSGASGRPYVAGAGLFVLALILVVRLVDRPTGPLPADRPG